MPFKILREKILWPGIKMPFKILREITLWPGKGRDIQHFLCDKGGGHKMQRYAYSSACGKSETKCSNKMDLNCKVALVTGGACGIGFAIANELLHEGLHKVVIGDLDPGNGLKAAHKLNEQHGEEKCCFVPLNVACTKQFEEVLGQVKGKYENIDILVNNAAIISSDIDLETDTNYRSILFSTKLVLDMMKGQKNKGLVINIGDTKGLSGCKFFPVYASGKSGVHGFSMSQGRESETNFNARVVALAPGLTETDMGEKFINKPAPAQDSQRTGAVGKSAIYLAKYANSGTLYVIEKRKLYRVLWPASSTIYDYADTM